MTQAAVISNGLPRAGLAQLEERWFCNPRSFPHKFDQSLGFLRFLSPLGTEISARSARHAAPKSAQSILSVIKRSGEADG